MLNTSEELITAIGQGEMIILMDDEDRENEGDLVMAANHVKPEHINFMAKHARGLICLTLTQQRCQQLGLPLMVQTNSTPYGTNFTTSIEAAQGVTTGISAADRAKTIQTAIAKDAKPTDLRQPGHIFPVMARPGGVLSRAGHTEAGCDLAALAGQEPAAVIIEIMNEDGTMARRKNLETFAQQHNLKIGTIADLIHYRSIHDKTVKRATEGQIITKHGEFTLITYQSTIDKRNHYVLVKGNITADKPTIVRVHIQDPLFDLIGEQQNPSRWPLDKAINYAAQQKRAAIVILARQQTDETILTNLKAKQNNQPQPAQEHDDIRLIGTGSQILADLGVGKMHLLGAPRKYHALSGFNLIIEKHIEHNPE